MGRHKKEVGIEPFAEEEVAKLEEHQVKTNVPNGTRRTKLIRGNSRFLPRGRQICRKRKKFGVSGQGQSEEGYSVGVTFILAV